MIFNRTHYSLQNILNKSDLILHNEEIKKIFFLETHLGKNRELTKARQACSVESAAKINTDMEVYLIFFTTEDGINMKNSELIDALTAYSNINIRFLNPAEFSKGTPLQEFFAENRIQKSSNPIEHMSDIVRILLLNRYGGQYLDLDVLSLIPLSVINRNNFACPESKNIITNAIINLDLEGGKAISDLYLDSLSKKYEANSWGGNGGFMLTSSVRAFCNNSDIPDHIENRCGNFTTFPSVKCYPYGYGGWKNVFDEKLKNEVLERIKNTGAYFIHIWNKMQDFDKTHYELMFSSNSAYMHLAKVHCPKTYRTLVKFFK